MEETLPPDDPRTSFAMNNLAMAYARSAQLEKAIPLFAKAYDAMKDRLGSHHPNTLDMQSNLAGAYLVSGRLDESIAHYLECVAAYRQILGPGHSDTLRSMNFLAQAYIGAGRQDEAIPLYEQALAARREKLGPNHAETIDAMNVLAWVLATAPTDHLRNGRRAVQLASEACKLTDYKVPAMLDTLAAAYAETGDFTSAIKWSEKAIELLGDDDAAQRTTLERALASYKAGKPTRQGAEHRVQNAINSSP